jgi:hypothetical protein
MINILFPRRVKIDLKGSEVFLTQIRVAGGVYDFRNF